MPIKMKRTIFGPKGFCLTEGEDGTVLGCFGTWEPNGSCDGCQINERCRRLHGTVMIEDEKNCIETRREMEKKDKCKGLLGMVFGHKWRYREMDKVFYPASKTLPYGITHSRHELHCSRCGRRLEFE